jgi:predicted nucleic acid-binding protein
MRFLDTDVLLYAISKDASERPKAEIAIEILDSPPHDLGLSVQILQEFYVQATRPTRPGALTHALAEEYLDLWQGYKVQENSVEVLRAAVSAAKRYRISFWDAAVIEAARTLGCETVLSEDLDDGQRYGGVRVRNPFRKGRAIST